MASLIGKEIGKYRITERLGQGGMAEVYAGVHTHLDRKVAVKVLHSYLLEGGDFVARFKREAKAVANLRHPNIVQVYDFDIQDDLIFMVMEYIDGVNLHAKLVEIGNRGERMPIKLIGSIINDIASALDYAHTKDMLHRDIKPSNIMIDGSGKAYLTDFGIAKLLTDQKFTATGTLVGTPAYMSPEQSMGDDVSKESDIYSLGVVAFEMLTGQVPYDAKTPIGIVHKQINDPVPDMSTLVDGVPGSAQEVIDRALAKAPESRFSSAEDLVGALRTALAALESTDPIAVPAEEPPTVVDDGLDAPTVTMDADDLEQPTVVMQEEKPAKEKKPQKEAKPIPVKDPGDKKKIPLWGVIAGGVAILAVIGVILTQVLGIGLPGTEPNQPGAIEARFIAQDASSTIYAFDDGDQDYQDVTVGNVKAIQSGNGEVISSEDGNTTNDLYLTFDVADDLIHQLPDGSEVTVLVEFLDRGTDSFGIQYDSHTGGEEGDGNFRYFGSVTKTDTGVFKTAQFDLTDVHFGNRIHGGDFRIGDDMNGAEVIASITVIYNPPAAGEEGLSASSSPEGEELFNQAFDAYQAGDDPAAIELCYQALDAGLVSADVYNLIGRAHRRLGEYDAAVEMYSQAIELDPDYFWARYGRGRTRLDQGDPWGAIEDLLVATELNPDNTSAWTYLGTAYFYSGEEGNMGPAHEALDRAVDLDPENYAAHLTRGELLWFHFGSEDAIEDFNIAVDLAPEGEPRPFSSRGIYFRQTDQYQACIEDLTIYIERDPGNPWGFYQRGECYQQLGENDPARADYETFLGMAEGNPDFGDVYGEVEDWLEQN